MPNEQELSEENLKTMRELSKNASFLEQLTANAINPANERKSLTWAMRNEIFKKVIEGYSMLKKDKGIFHAQLMCAMDEYMKECNDTGFKIVY